MQSGGHSSAKLRMPKGAMLTSALPFVALSAIAPAHAQTVENAASISAPAGANEISAANNNAVDSDTVLAVLAASDDSATGINGVVGGTAVVNAFTADTVNGAAASPANATLALAPGATVPAGLSFDPATGNVDVAPGTAAGTYSFDYQLCELANPTNCKTATITVEVVAAPIEATADNPPSVNGATGGDDIINAFDNDRLNNDPVDPNAITATITTPATPNNPGDPVPVMDPVTGLVDVPPGTPAGTYTIAYQICEELNPTNCADSTVTIVVDASPIEASDDTAGPVGGIAGGSDLINALDNDTLNGEPVDIDNIDLTITSPASNPGVTLDPATGLVSVAPGTPAGSYTIGYRICEELNPTNCADASITVVVEAAPIAAEDDAPAPVNGADGGDDIINALDNDTLNGQPVDINDIDVTIVTPATPLNGAPVPALDTETGLVDVPAGTPAGTYTIEYEICETLNPANCATSTVTVVVEAPEITADADSPAPVRQGIGNPNAINAFDNDTLNGDPVDPADINAQVITPASNPGVVLDPATGNVSITDDVPAGTYTIEYEICETLNPTNCAVSTVTVVVEPPVSAIEGTVFTDTDGDGELDDGEPLLEGWIVEVVRDGEVVGTAITDGNGFYRIEDLPSGPGYEVLFRNPENNVVYDVIEDLTLGDNVTTVDQNLPIDPSGVVYDSVTRQPVAGVTAVLLGANGNPLPAICFIDPSQASQITGASGQYRFDIIPGAAPQCPTGETEYTIALTPPAGFGFVSTVLTPEAGPFDPTGLTAPVRISPDADAPTEADPTYYLTFALASGDPDIINNHIPIDPFLTRSPLVVTKTSPKRSASTGDLVPYEITVRNTENAQRSGVTVVDILPPGMKYVLGTATVDGTAQEPVATNVNRQLEWRDQVIPANGSVRYNLTLVVGAGVTNGQKVNTGLGLNGVDGAAISNRGTSVIQIVPSRVFDCSELIGKVFEDRNRNGYQDEGEPGVPGVRLATVNGQLITTDQFGRYHITCAAVPNARIGSNFVLKLDSRTLPLGWEVVHDNPQSIRLTRGKFGELNFGVAPPLEENTPTKNEEKGE